MNSEINDCWDQLLDPHQDAVESGRKEGYHSGLESGFKDGYQLGKLKAFEIGIELGYMKSIAQETMKDLKQCSNTHDYGIDEEKKMKLQKKAEDIIQSIDQFPSPDDMFSCLDDDPMNIVDDMQRIRAKFKVFLVQWKLPHLTLKKVMNEHTAVLEKDDTTDQEW